MKGYERLINEEKQIEEMAQAIFDYVDTKNMGSVYICGNKANEKAKPFLHNTGIAEFMYRRGYRKASEVIGEFVEKINLVECEMFHKAHDIRNSSEEKLDRCNWKDDLQWGEYKKQEGKMIALQDFMTKIKRIAAECGVEVEE